MNVKALKLVRSFASPRHYREWYKAHWERDWIRKVINEYVSAIVVGHCLVVAFIIILVSIVRGAI